MTQGDTGVQGDTGGYGGIRPLDGMTQERWDALTPAERDRLRDPCGLHPVLRHWTGWRVEVEYYGERRRFNIGQTCGWQPATLGLHNRRSMSSCNILTEANCTLLRPIRPIYKD